MLKKTLYAILLKSRLPPGKVVVSYNWLAVVALTAPAETADPPRQRAGLVYRPPSALAAPAAARAGEKSRHSLAQFAVVDAIQEVEEEAWKMGTGTVITCLETNYTFFVRC